MKKNEPGTAARHARRPARQEHTRGMNLRHICTALLAALLAAPAARAGDGPESPAARDGNAGKYEAWGFKGGKSWGVTARAGYVIGGTTPFPLPAEIRSINRFRPNGGLTFGVDVRKDFSLHWGLTGGLHFFMEGMGTGADVKNYHMGIRMGEDYLEGQFTGTDETNVRMGGFTIPVAATYRISPRWTVNAGPYLSVLLSREFSGSVYDGYLRVNDPTGEKIVISRENPATYDFSGDLRRLQWGVEAGFEWRATRSIGVLGSIDWGLSDVFRDGFKTVEFPMYPIYATLGVTYQLY